MENNLENMWIVHVVYDNVTLESVACSNYIQAANYANEKIRLYEDNEEYRQLIKTDGRFTMGHAADQDLYAYLLEVPVRDIELTIGCELKKKETSISPWERCMHLMATYMDAQPDMEEIEESKYNKKFVFPCGISVRFTASGKNSKVANFTMYDKDGGYLGDAMVMYKPDIDFVNSKIIRALTAEQ